MKSRFARKRLSDKALMDAITHLRERRQQITIVRLAEYLAVATPVISERLETLVHLGLVKKLGNAGWKVNKW